MSAPLNANGVAAQLAQLARDLDACINALDGSDRESVVKREDYTLAYARAFLKAQGAMDARKQIAIEETHAERLAAEVADQVVRGLRRRIDSIKTRIDVGRSVGAAVRAEISLGEVGHP